MNHRGLLKEAFAAAVCAADPALVVPANLPPSRGGALFVLGAGKASAAMAAAVENAWQTPAQLQGTVVTRYGHACATRAIEVLQAAHPVPDQAALDAAARVLDTARRLTPADRLLVLLSGGGSCLLSLPVPGVSLDDYRQLTLSLLRGGVPIEHMNVLRKHLSLTQGGRLAAATRAGLEALIISDVPGDDISAIASGPCSPDPSTYGEALDILSRWHIQPPPSIAAHLAAGARGEIAETPKPGDPCFDRAHARIIASARLSLMAAARHLQTAGVEVINLGDAITGEARDVAREQAQRVLALRSGRSAGSAPLALLSGGECTVTVRGEGRGGRCSEFLLALHRELAGMPGVHALACDTDGIDGTEDNAGACFGPDTYSSAQALGLDAGAFLARNDSHGYFAALGELVVTGPTRTNVNDFRCVLLN
jgi:glycerate 2-kinase